MMPSDGPPWVPRLYCLAAGQEAGVSCKANPAPLTRPVKRSDTTPGRGSGMKSPATAIWPRSHMHSKLAITATQGAICHRDYDSVVKPSKDYHLLSDLPKRLAWGLSFAGALGSKESHFRSEM